MHCLTLARQQTARVTRWFVTQRSTCIVNCMVSIVAASTLSLCHPLRLAVRVPIVSQSHLKLVRESIIGVFLSIHNSEICKIHVNEDVMELKVFHRKTFHSPKEFLIKKKLSV